MSVDVEISWFLCLMINDIYKASNCDTRSRFVQTLLESWIMSLATLHTLLEKDDEYLQENLLRIIHELGGFLVTSPNDSRC